MFPKSKNSMDWIYKIFLSENERWCVYYVIITDSMENYVKVAYSYLYLDKHMVNFRGIQSVDVYHEQRQNRFDPMRVRVINKCVFLYKFFRWDTLKIYAREFFYYIESWWKWDFLTIGLELLAVSEVAYEA